MKNTILALALAGIASACVSPKAVSLADLEASRARNLAAATKTYEGRSIEDVRTAAFEVIKLLNPNEMRFDVRSDRLLASQTYLLNLILSGSSGQRWYEVVFSQDATGARVQLGLDQEMEQTAIIVPTKKQSFRQDIAVGSNEDFLPNSTLFFERLDYMLGVRTQWPTCSEFEKEHHFTPAYFCGGFVGGIGISDQTPAGPTPGPARSSR